MTAISKAWVTMTDAATDADSPIDQALMQGYRDDLVHLREWLGASYYPGAAQDHSHDGVNSALVEWAHMDVFTASGSWTVPAGVTRCKVTVVAGGGAGGGQSGAGGTGGASSFGAYLTATGGAGAATWSASAANGGANGTGAGTAVQLAIGGESGHPSNPGIGVSGKGGSSVFGGGGRALVANLSAQPGQAYGAGGAGSGNSIAGSGAAGGGAGGCAVGIVTGLTPGGAVTVTVGAGGTCGGAYPGGAGKAGIVIVEY